MSTFRRDDSAAGYFTAALFGSAVIALGVLSLVRSIKAGNLVEEDVDPGLRLRTIIDAVPHCIIGCIYPRVLNHGCAHSDHVCMCHQLHVLDDPCNALTAASKTTFKSCVEECNYWDQVSAPSKVLDLCEEIEAPVQLPDFMQDTLRIFGRQEFSSAGNLAPSIAPPPPITTTITITLPPGIQIPTTSTEDRNGDVVVIVGVLAASSGPGSPATVPAVATPAATTPNTGTGSLPTPSPTSQSSSSSSAGSSTTSNSFLSIPTGGASTTTSTDHSNGSKIAVSVAVVVVALILLGLATWYILRRRKRSKAPPYPPTMRETTDGGLPEPMSTIHETALPKSLPPAYQPRADAYGRVPVEAGGVPIDRINPETGAYAEYQANQAHELTSDPSKPRYELPIDAPSASPAQVTNRKPVAQSAAFPAPWEGDMSHEYAPKTELANTNMDLTLPDDDAEIRQMEEEAERLRQERERLLSVNALQAKEDELRRNIERRRAAASKSPSGG